MREAFWIDDMKPVYNVGDIGGGDNFSNNPNKEIVREKITQSVRNRIANRTDEEIQFLSKKMTGPQNPNWRHGKTAKNRKCPMCGGPISYYHTNCFECSLTLRKGDKNSFYGKSHSEETKKKLSEQRKGKYNGNQRKKIKIDDILYQSYSDAARALGVGVALIAYRVKRKYPNYITITD